METAKPSNTNVDKLITPSQNFQLNHQVEKKLDSKEHNFRWFEEYLNFFVRNFWILVTILLVLITAILSYFFYVKFPEVKNVILDITGQNTPANTIKGILKGYRDRDLSAVEKYADIDKVVDGVVDSLVENLKSDKRYSALFGTDDVKVVLNEKLDDIRIKYKKDLRTAIVSGEIDINWEVVGKLFLDDSFSSALEKGNLIVNGNEAQFEITTPKGILVVKMNKMQSLWKVQSVIAKDDWTGFLGN